MSRPRKHDSQREKYQRYLKEIGRAGYTPAGPVRERIIFLHERKGVTLGTIAERTGLYVDTIKCQYNGINAAGQAIRWCEKATEIAVLRAKFTPADVSWPPAVGPRRRLQALFALGYTTPFLGAQMGMDNRVLHRFMSGLKGKKTVKADFATAVADLYDKLSTTDPLDAGVHPHAIPRTKAYAASHGYAPPSCWDVDTIDDPDAIPEWTGRCGSVYGWRIHELENIPACPPCIAARDSGSGELSGARLRDLRVRRGLSQVQLATMAGLKDDQYRSWESGRTKPRYPEQLNRILVVLDATYEDVVE